MPWSAEGRHPKIFPELPVGFGEILIVEAFAFFEDEDGIALFGQAHGGDRTAKAGTDDDIVKIFCSTLAPLAKGWMRVFYHRGEDIPERELNYHC